MTFNRQIFRIVVFSVSSILFGILVFFFSKAEWIMLLKFTPLFTISTANVLLYFIIAPIILTFNIMQIFSAAIEIFNSNSRIKSIIGFFVELVKTAQTAISLAWKTPLLLAAPLVVPISLVVVMAIDALFHAGCFLFHAWQWHRVGREENRLMVAKHSFSFIVSTLATIGLGIMFLSGIGPAALLPIGIITAIIIAVGGTFSTLFGSYISRKIEESYQRIPDDVPDDENEEQERPPAPRRVARTTEEPLHREERNVGSEIYREPPREGERLVHDESSSLIDSATLSKKAALLLRNTEINKSSHVLRQEWTIKPSLASLLFFKETKNCQLNTNKVSSKIKLKAMPSL